MSKISKINTTPRYFEYQDDKSNKFWEITRNNATSFEVRYGRIGSDGATSIKRFANSATLEKEYSKIVREKLNKGYVETTENLGRQMREVLYSIENEGFDYAFRHYSSFKEVKDEEFHRLRKAYVEAAELLQDYIDENADEEEDEDEDDDYE